MKIVNHILALCVVVSAPLAIAVEVIESYPASGDTLKRPLRSIHIMFDELPEDTQNAVKITGAKQTYDVAGLHTMGNDDLMALVPNALPDGNYSLTWRVGDNEGAVPFAVKRPPGTVDDTWEPPLDIGIVLYDGAEPLDVFGPLEMWMNLGPNNARVHLIAETKRPIALTTTSYPKALAPRLEAQYSFDDAPELDVLMVPGGVGTLVEVDNPRMIAYLKKASQNVAVATSVCTGSALYAKAGVLKDVRATGNKAFFDYITQQGPADWQAEARWVESGRFVTSSGVSAGIDMSLAVIERFFGRPAARMVAASTEYEWQEDATRDPFIDQMNSAVPWVEFIRKNFEEEAP